MLTTEKIGRDPEIVEGLILKILLDESESGSRGFISPGEFYSRACELGYTGSQEDLNRIAENMEGVEGAEMGKFQTVYYRLRRDN